MQATRDIPTANAYFLAATSHWSNDTEKIMVFAPAER
jgi:hypothetical protein